MALHLTGDPASDRVLDEHAFGLLAGMMLDQQVPMERAFAGPAVILERFGTLDPQAIAEADPDEFASLCATPPAVHRYPTSMAGRLQALAGHVVEHYGGDTSRIWTEAIGGAELIGRLTALPGFGKQKAQIFLALLGKQLGVRLDGWQQAAGKYADPGSHRSVADVVDKDSLERVRAFKQELKRAAKMAARQQ